VREITGAPAVNVMGYCIGGTLLAMTLAWLAAKGDKRFNAATFMVSMQDFSRVGDTAIFMDEPAIDLVEQQMMERGYLDSREMSNMFNLLRSNDLIWANVVNNYLMGEKPPAFDLLHWNSDGTRMCRAAHAWYLRNTYKENNLVQPGKIELKGEPIDLGRISLDTYAVARRRTTSSPGTPRGASRSSSAARCATCSPRRATSPASSTRRAARAPTGSTRRTRRRHARGVAQGRGAPRRQLVDGLDGVARGAVGRKGQAAGDGQRRAPAARGRAGTYVLEK
jgi:hypothetical protein